MGFSYIFCDVTSSGLHIYSTFCILWVSGLEENKGSTRKWKLLTFQISHTSSPPHTFFLLVTYHKPQCGALFASSLLSMAGKQSFLIFQSWQCFVVCMGIKWIRLSSSCMCLVMISLESIQNLQLVIFPIWVPSAE